MGAITGAAGREHLVVFARVFAWSAVVFFAVPGCAEDDVAPARTPAVVAEVPIVDMSPSAQRPLLPAETPVIAAEPAAVPAAATPVPARGSAVISSGDVAALRARRLLVPVAGVRPANLVGSFSDARGERVHQALDIGAPRGTPVLSADDGTVLKLFTSRAGGLTIYAADPTKSFIYYYAHLDAYAPTLVEGQALTKGQQIATVGVTGNARNIPHLHFAIMKNSDMKRWWTGTAIDPYPILRPTAAP